VACGSVAELSAQHGGRLAIEVGAIDDNDAVEEVAGAVPGVVDVRREGELVVVGAQDDVRRELSRALSEHGIVITHLRLRAEELGEVYHRYFLAGVPA
jgi:ABC-2 type transport system ATP-binding protein